MLPLIIFLAFIISCMQCAVGSVVQKDGTPSPLEIYPNGVPEDQKRFVNFRLNQFMDFRAKSDNFGGFISYLNNGISSHVPEAGMFETPFKDSFATTTGSSLNNLIRENAEIKRDLLRLMEIERSCNYDNRTNVLSRSPRGVFYDKSFDEAKVSNKTKYPSDCQELMRNGINKSGIYKIQPPKSAKPFMALCDMEIRSGGWTHIHKRFDGSQDFLLGWREYKFGFGDLEGEFWLGLENIHFLTESGQSELLVELEDRDGVKAYAHYTVFTVGSESEGYVLKSLSGFSGDAGNSLQWHQGSKFSTKDFDQDTHATWNCAEIFLGAWWHKDCHTVNLNGKFRNVDLPKAYEYKGLHWKDFRGHNYSHAKARMLVKIR